MPTKSRETQALNADWAELSRRLKRFALALTGSGDEAEDLTQQTIATLLAKRPEMVGHAGYARRTLARIWMDRERSLRRRMARAVGWGRMRPVTAAEGDGGERAEELERLRREIECLPVRQRLAITLRLVEGLGYEQIAEVMECEVGAVRANLHLARRRLRAVLGDET